MKKRERTTSSTDTVLVLTSDHNACIHFSEKLKGAEVSVQYAQHAPMVMEMLRSLKHPVCVIRSDRVTNDHTDILHFIHQHNLPTKVIISVASGTVHDAVCMMKAGAVDYFVGDCTDPRLIESVLKTTTHYRETHPFTKTPAEHQVANGFVLVGESPAICEIRSAVSLVARSQTTVLITGESGTGKEVVARLIHEQSPRGNQQFVAMNCASLPKDVIENELFGHEKGAFTGALLKKAGCFELADGGTLLFDEIAEMSLETQAKLLRAIETQKFRRLGGRDEISVNVRMIAATNKDVAAALKSKELREDLYYRLSVIEIFIPPLRERKEDVPPLVDYNLDLFSVKYGKPRQHFTDEALAMLGAYHWPGNVRELRNVIERALVICPHEFIGPHYLPERIKPQDRPQQHINIPVGCSTQEAERMLIIETLASAGNNKAKAAKILGMSRKTLHNKLTSFSQE